MIKRLVLAVAALVLVAVLSTACSSPQYCAAQQSPNGPILYAYLLSLSKFYPKHPGGYLDRGLIVELLKQLQAGIYDLCGQIVCADSEAAARTAFAGAVGVANLNDPSLFVYQLGYSEAEVRVAEAPANAAWLASGAPCIGGYATEGADAGTGGGSSSDAGPCALAGELCSEFSSTGVPNCCDGQQVVLGAPSSSLLCEATSATGICRVNLGSPCNTSDDCFQVTTPDGSPAECIDVCGYGQGRDCWRGSGALRGGCLPGFDCVVDAIGGDGSIYWCQ